MPRARFAISRVRTSDYDALPIFAMTANAFVDDVRKTKEAGMNGHFAKPLDFTVLLTTLHQQLK